MLEFNQVSAVKLRKEESQYDVISLTELKWDYDDKSVSSWNYLLKPSCSMLDLNCIIKCIPYNIF